MNKLLTAQEVADLLHIATSTVYKYAENGTLPSIQIGTNRRFSAEELEVFLRSGTAVPSTPTQGA